MRTTTVAEAHRTGYELARRHTARFVDYVRALSPADVALGVPGLTWTVGETVSHVESVFERYTTDPRRGADPHGVGELNGEDVARLGVDVVRSAATIEGRMALLAGGVDIDPATTFDFHGGQRITMAAGWGNLLGELFVHGDDIARATGRPFGMPGEDLEIVWRHCLPLLAGWLRPEAVRLVEDWRLDLPFGSLEMLLDHGIVSVQESDGPAPAGRHVVVDDLAAATLQFPYRRRPVTAGPLALLASRFTDI